MKRVCVVGGDPASLVAACALDDGLWGRRNVQVSLIHPDPYIDWDPLLPEVASGAVSSRAARVRIEDVLGTDRVRCVPDTITGLDLEARVLRGAEAEYAFDLLIVAPGVTYPSAAGQWLPYETVAHAARISRTVMSQASATVASPAQQKILVRGDGVRAVELATALSWGCDDAMARRGFRAFEVSLWTEGEPDLGGSLVKVVRDDLDAGIRIDARDGRPPSWLGEAGLTTADDGTLLVADNLAVRGFHDVFAAGRCAARSSSTPWPDTPLTMWQMGNLAAHNVCMELVGASHEPLVPWPIDGVTRLGESDGRARVVGLPLRGELARMVARMLVAGSIPTAPRKIAVLAEWMRVGRRGGDWASLPLT